LNITIDVSELNNKVTSRKHKVALEKAKELKLNVKYVCTVPGVFDMHLVIDVLLQKKDIDAVVTLGAIIKGPTKHDEIIADVVATRISTLSTKHQKPVSLATAGPGMSARQAFARIRPVSERAVEAVFNTAKELKRIK